MRAIEKFALTLVVLITDVLSLLLFRDNLEEEGYATDDDDEDSENSIYYHHHYQYNSIDLEKTESAFGCSNPIALARNLLLLMLSSTRGRLKTTNTNKISWPNRTGLVGVVDAKGVAGIGKAGGDAQGGSDKAGQQVPPEVYNALTYAGSAFLFTLSVPLILYGLNKVLNKVEECFGCRPSTKKRVGQTKSSGNNNNGNGFRSNNQKIPGSAESIGAPFTISHDQQQFQNQQQFYNQQQLSLQAKTHQQQLHHQLQQQSPTISASHESVAHLHHNHEHLPHHLHNNHDQRQQQSSSSSPQITSAQLSAGALATSAPATTMPSSKAITLPFDSELNYKASTMAQHFQQPYIISSP